MIAQKLTLKALQVNAGAALPALAVALGYYLAARVGLAFTLQPDPISTLWPPNALLMAALLLSAPRSWWVLLAAALPAHLLAELQSGVPLAMVLGWFASNCSEALIGAALVRWCIAAPVRLDSLRNAFILLAFGGLVAPLASSFLDAGLVKLVGFGEGEYWTLVRTRFSANVLAEITIVPLVLAWASWRPAAIRATPLAHSVEVAALFLGLFAVSLLAFDLPLFGASLAPALWYAPLPFLLWAAVRLGTIGTTSALALLVVATIWGAVHGVGPFTGGTPQDTARDLQLFLIAASVPLLLLAVALEERSRAEREAHEQRLQLTHLSRVAMLGEMSGGLAHELNQPLTAILSNAQAAEHLIANKTIDNNELREILRDIIAANQRASEVIRRLRALFKRGETYRERLDANELVRETLSLAQGDLATRSIAPVLKLAPGTLAIHGDRIQLEQVMLNLILNGAEAMAGHTAAERTITVRSAGNDSWVYVSFADRGPGFAPELIEKLFEPFYTTKPQGLGLGLSISRSIVLAHGGRLWGASHAAHGASFHIALPAVRSS
ncbi:MAG TPA: MASE1 domain-containing protein [Burkholderiales bacterium]